MSSAIVAWQGRCLLLVSLRREAEQCLQSVWVQRRTAFLGSLAEWPACASSPRQCIGSCSQRSHLPEILLLRVNLRFDSLG